MGKADGEDEELGSKLGIVVGQDSEVEAEDGELRKGKRGGIEDRGEEIGLGKFTLMSVLPGNYMPRWIVRWEEGGSVSHLEVRLELLCREVLPMAPESSFDH